jgi:hypothetical protein
VSAAESKLRQKIIDKTNKDMLKMLDSRVTAASKAINKMSSTKVALEALINKQEFGTLPDMVRVQLQRLLQKLESINEQCNILVETEGHEGDIITLQDTIHT